MTLVVGALSLLYPRQAYVARVGKWVALFTGAVIMTNEKSVPKNGRATNLSIHLYK